MSEESVAHRTTDEQDERHGFAARPERIILVVQPYARSILEECQSQLPFEMRLLAFQQYRRVKVLHIMAHPSRHQTGECRMFTLLQVKYRNVILDMQTSAHQLATRDKDSWTPSYRAPEMEIRTNGRQ